MWLGEKAGDYAGLLQPAAAGIVRLWAVSRAVNNMRNSRPELLAPMADARLETLEETALDVNST